MNGPAPAPAPAPAPGPARIQTARNDSHDESRVGYAKARFLRFAATGWSLAFVACPEIVKGLSSILHGWKMGPIAPSCADAEIVCNGGSYSWYSPSRPRPRFWEKEPPLTAMNVITSIHDVLFDWYLEDHPDLLCLHAGAVDMGNALVCFPSTRKAGKTSLCVALVHRGYTMYCDDVLPVDPGSLLGVAMGIAPLVRKPLPASFGELLSFVRRRQGPCNDRWTYLKLRPPEIALHGEMRCISAFVLLERKPRARADLCRIEKSAMLKEVIMQNFARRDAPAAVLEVLANLVGNAECFRLIYDELSDGADVISRHFGRVP
jgi:hypothetical protein